jgi:putative transposase
MGTVGDALDNAVVEAFWARMQVELLNRKKWRTRVELANAIFEYLEIFHDVHPNRVRDHPSDPSTRGMRIQKSSSTKAGEDHGVKRNGSSSLFAVRIDQNAVLDGRHLNRIAWHCFR